MKYKSMPVLVFFLVLVIAFTAQAMPQRDLSMMIDPGKIIKPLTVTSPKGGEVWQAGIEQTITWSYNPAQFKAQTVNILLLKGDTVVDTIAQSVSAGSNGHGSYKWSTLNVAPGTGYRIKIVGITGMLSRNAPSAISGYFTVTDKAKITVTFPQTAGQTLHPGQQVTITWDYTGDIGDTLYLRLIHGSDLSNGGLLQCSLIPKRRPAAADMAPTTG